MSQANTKPNLTPDQRRGVETVGRSLLLSAAAGSGKTRVLAERCVYLVCDAPPPYRCDVDELLVVTFTEAAAAEMRERIGRTLASRVADRPDGRLQRQSALLEQAQISTLHSFCANLLRQHFHLVGLDPAFVVMDEHEATLLRLDVGRDLLRRRYEADRDQRLSQLLDGYYDGMDERLLSEILRIHDLTQSLVDPAGWIAQTLQETEQASAMPLAENRLGRELINLIRRRIIAQGGRCNLALKALRSLGRFEPYEAQVLNILQIYRHLYRQLQTRSVDVVAEELAGIDKLPPVGAVKGTVANKDLAKDQVDAVAKEFKEGSWRTLLKSNEAEWQDGMRRVLPHAKELLSLVEDFGREYARVKEETRQLDFSDLERNALKVLHDGSKPGLHPSSAARYYQRVFKHVLVDEYQDINELQNAILTLVSHESVAGDGGEPNLFAVGDVKQSIYRFRLADPKQFLDREKALREGGDRGEVIDLRQNFRGRGPLLDAINRVFERLMTRSAVEIEYDQTQRLVAGRNFADAGGAPVFAGSPIELQLLPRDPGEDDPAEQSIEELDRTEREAIVAAMRINQIVGRGDGPAMHVYDRKTNSPRPATFGDIVILLRSRKHKSNQFVRMLEKFGIPSHTESGSGFFDSSEIRDMLSLLGLLDNQAQDLELAAFLRSPMAGLKNAPDIMATAVVAFRESTPRVPFHEAISRYAIEKTDAYAAELRQRLEWLATLRHQANRRPVHETIWAIYQETGYLAYVAGLPGGRQRSANLIQLYDRARSFGTHRRQDLGRFLDFLKTLEAESDVGQPSVATEAQDVVRIMTVHGSKGLEFPIVILPDLGKMINTFDAAGAVVVDRTFGLGLKVVNEELFARYPSVSQLVIEDQIKSKLMAEELRVLYVAMTRAMEHLILIGTADARAVEGWEKRWTGHEGPLTDADILNAGTMLGWLGPVWAADQSADRPTIELHRRRLSELKDPRPWTERSEPSPLVLAVQQRQPLKPPAAMTREAQKVADRLEWAYPHEAESKQAAVSSVTALAKGTGGAGLPMPVSTAATSPTDRLALAPFIAPQSEPAATDKGLATHSVLQHLRFADADSRRQIEAQIDRMVSEGRLAASDRSSVDVATIEWFVATPLGRLLRENEGKLMREMPVYVAIPPAGATDDGASGLDLMMVRGRADLFLPLTDGGVLVDYKTDNVSTADHIANRKQVYEPQMKAYGQAIERITGTPVRRRCLVFLTARRVEEV